MSEKGDNGIGKAGTADPRTRIAITVFIGIALYSVLELTFIIFTTFRKRQGLYFWSFLVSTWGIALYAVGFLIKELEMMSNSILYVTLIVVGWCAMVTGQSVVLYSRLHLVMRNPTKERLILIMIIVNAFICHVPIIVMIYGAESNNSHPYILPYTIYEKVQVTIFFIQELIISGLYIFHTIKVLQPEGNIRGKTSRRVMTHLTYVNIFIVILDITILGLEYSGLYSIQTAYKALVYSVKLKLEFSILARLVELTQGTIGSSSDACSGHGTMALETFDGTRRKRGPKGHGHGTDYIAHVTSAPLGKGTDDGIVNPVNDSIVVTTTRIATHSDEEWGKRDGESGSESLDTRTGVGLNFVETRTAEESRARSSFSSQRELAQAY